MYATFLVWFSFFGVEDSAASVTAPSFISECPTSGARPEFRVAIIGAGPSGTSAAYYLAKAQEKLEEARKYGLGTCKNTSFPERLYVTVYERSDRVGGRAWSVHPLDDPSIAPVESGASIFAKMNTQMRQATQAMDLKAVPRESMPRSDYGLWNGRDFVIDKFDGTKWDQLKMYWRYGNSPQTFLNLYVLVRLTFSATKAASSFTQLYNPSFLHKRTRHSTESESGYPWSNVSDIIHRLGLQHTTSQSARDLLLHNKVSDTFVDEMVNALTRAIYAQSVSTIHAVAAMVAAGAPDAFSIRGGNEQLFQRLLEKSGAYVRFGVQGEVTGLMKMSASIDPAKPGHTEWWVGTKDGHGEVYNAVILATPWHDAGITLLNTHHTVPSYKFQHLHVTIVVTSSSKLNVKYFAGAMPLTSMPHTILTTTAPDGTEPEFLSMSYLRQLNHATYKGKTWNKLFVVKILSQKELEDDTLARLFGPSSVLWTTQKTWSAYPELPPTDKFGRFEIDDNLWNINALERWISTMETSLLASKNVVALLLQKWLGAAFILGQACKWEPNVVREATAWAGWGCQNT
ncbi:prenylcysteine oxidase precursor [Malassezia pachydermatis]|uniref:Prenylcysteine oxidase n=1 Tax=Malassezia pachydermatis TaxID=77020 RepID=A0A0M9VQ59_9BASI|nr:prenylcysteine oxidase precursor [Malassezia pachydermatis]KOS15169.1 prenylcysteine oxidase precursor [Malassezia pachydermatis]